MKHNILRLLLLVALLAPASLQSQEQYSLEIVGKPHFSSQVGTKLSDTIIVDFNIWKTSGLQDRERGMFIERDDSVIINVTQSIYGRTRPAPQYIPNSLTPLRTDGGRGNIPESITVSLLIDRSDHILPEHMNKIKEAVRQFTVQLPEGSVFYSWFHDIVSSSTAINKWNFDEATNFENTFQDSDLFNAIHMKLLEFDTLKIPNSNAEREPGYVPNYDLARRNSDHNYLVVLTNGLNTTDIITKYLNPDYRRITEPRLFQALGDFSEKVTVYVLGFGDEGAFYSEDVLVNIARANNNPAGYFRAEPDSVIQRFETIIDEIAGDYQALFRSPQGQTYRGEPIVFSMEIMAPIVAWGETTYSICSRARPCSTEKTDTTGTLLWGLLFGTVFFIIVMIIIQLIWPLIKNWIFSIKNVLRYRSSNTKLKKTCPYCYDEFIDGEKIVVKCEHIVHKECWQENMYMCPEYGQNCSEGKQDYFDISDPFAKKNKLFYLNWVIFGLLGGFFSWITYMLLIELPLFDSFSQTLVRLFSSEARMNNMSTLVDKTAPLFSIGIMMGFFLSLVFAYIEDYRRRSFAVLMKILLRGLIGAAVGFLSFLIGNIIIILINPAHESLWTDWIPWLFFGGMIGYSLTIKTTLVWKHGLLGGVVSILFSFILIYVLTLPDGLMVLLVAFMFYGSGLGASIATVRSTAEHYFLSITNGPKQGNQIAVHKWMNAQGGLNEVYIGRANNCEVQINWEKKMDIAEKHAKMYINKSRKMPVLVSLQKDKTTLYDERIEMMVGKEYDLVNGITFKIGETVFQYVEKE